MLLIECGQCLVTIVLNGEQSALEFIKLDLKSLNLVRSTLFAITDVCILI